MDKYARFMLDYREDVEYGKAELADLVGHVIGKLEEFLGLPVQAPAPLEDHVGERICFDVSSPRPFGGGLGLSWKGIFALVVVKDLRPIEFGVSLFLYSHGKKLNIQNDEHSCIAFVYALKDGEGRWSVADWFNDEYGEFERFKFL